MKRVKVGKKKRKRSLGKREKEEAVEKEGRGSRKRRDTSTYVLPTIRCYQGMYCCLYTIKNMIHYTGLNSFSKLRTVSAKLYSA
jgi:hypothetical protein